MREYLKKEKLTPKEAGELFIFNAIKNRTEHQSIFTDKELILIWDKVHNNSSASEREELSKYTRPLHWLGHYSHIAQAAYQQAQSGFTRIFFKVKYSTLAEKGLRELQDLSESLPQKQPNKKMSLQPLTVRLSDITYKSLSNISSFSEMDNQNEKDFLSFGLRYIKHGCVSAEEYNVVVGLLSELVNIPSLRQAYFIDLDILYGGLNQLNKDVTALRKIIVGSEEEKKKKKRFIKEFFPKINVKEFKPIEKNIDVAREHLVEYMKRDSPYDIINLLRKGHERSR